MAVFVGLVVLSLVVIGLVGQNLLLGQQPSGGAYSLRESLKKDVEKAVYSYTLDFVNKLGESGLRLSGKNKVEYGGSEVAYWQMCQNTIYPQIEDVEKAIKNSVADFAEGLQITDFQGKKVVIEPLRDIEAVVNKDSVDLKIYMPTKIENREVSQPYVVSVPVGLGRAYDFARGFVEDNKAKRHFETFVASLFYQTDGSLLPTRGVLTSCGEHIFVPKAEAMKTVDKIISYALANTVLWSERQQQEYLKYHIPDINGKQYKELGIDFIYPETLSDDKFRPSVPSISVSNNKFAAFFIPICAKGYDIKYSATFPVIAEVKTPDGFKLRLGVSAYIDNSNIGSCTTTIDLSAGNPCSSQKCGAEITVKGMDANPVENAAVFFGSCQLGFTGKDGEVSGKATCGVSELSVSHPLYQPFSDVLSSSNLTQEVVLKRAPNLTINFNKMSVAKGLESSALALLPQSSVMGTSPRAAITAIFRPKKTSPWKQAEYIIANVAGEAEFTNKANIDYLPPDNYTVEITGTKDMTYEYTYCANYAGPFCTDHDTIRTPIVVTGKALTDFEVKETGREIFITAFELKEGTTKTELREIIFTEADGRVCAESRLIEPSIGVIDKTTIKQLEGCVNPVSISLPGDVKL